jgi:hypothetical protein
LGAHAFCAGEVGGCGWVFLFQPQQYGYLGGGQVSDLALVAEAALELAQEGAQVFAAGLAMSTATWNRYIAWNIANFGFAEAGLS